MAVPTEDALFEAPGAMRAILQHFNIVVGFQDQNVRTTHPFKDQLGGVTEISQNADVSSVRPQQETDRVLRVMWNTESLDYDIGHFEGSSGVEQAVIQSRFKLILERILRRAIAVNWDSQFLTQCCQSLHVVRMFVGDEDSRQILRSSPNEAKPSSDLPQTESGIDEEAGFVGFNVGAVTAGTAAQDCQANRHGPR